MVKLSIDVDGINVFHNETDLPVETVLRSIGVTVFTHGIESVSVNYGERNVPYVRGFFESVEPETAKFSFKTI